MIYNALRHYTTADGTPKIEVSNWSNEGAYAPITDKHRLINGEMLYLVSVINAANEALEVLTKYKGDVPADHSYWAWHDVPLAAGVKLRSKEEHDKIVETLDAENKKRNPPHEKKLHGAPNATHN